MAEYLLCSLLAVICAFVYDCCGACHSQNSSIASSSRSGVMAGNPLFRYLALWSGACVLWLLAGMRGKYVGADTRLYLQEFSTIVHHSGGYVHSDWGFRRFNMLVGLFSMNGNIFLLVCSGIAIFGFYYLASYFQGTMGISVLFFITSFNYFQIYSLIAQYTALGFLFIGTRFLLERKYAVAYIFVLLAGFMHSSAWIFIVFFVIKTAMDIMNNAWHLSLVSLAGLVCFAIVAKGVMPIILKSTRFAVYYQRDDINLNSTSILLISLAVLAFSTLVFAIRSAIRNNSKYQLFYIIVIFGVICSLLQNQVPLIVRMAIYCIAFYPIVIPLFIQALPREDLRVAASVLVIAAFAAWFFIYPLRLNYYEVFPYEAVPWFSLDVAS